MTRRLAIVGGAVILTAALLLALSGCEQYATYTPSAWDLTRLATEYPDGPDKLTVQAIAVERYATSSAIEVEAAQAAANATAVAAEQSANATAQAAQSSANATAQVGIVQATQQAAQQKLEQQRQWATQQAANATQCAQATAQAMAMAATAQALSIQATAEQRSYEATATAEARNVAATAAAQHKADVATATRQAWEGKTTATAESHQATVQVAHATMTRQAEKREEVLGYGRDYGIPAVLLILGAGLLAFIVYAVRQQARRPVVYPRNVLGDAEPMAVPVQGGGYTFVDLDRQPGPALTVLPTGQVAAPLLRSAGQEERTTARDQLVDAVARPKLGAGHKGQAPALPAPPQAPAPGLRSVRVLRRLDQAEKAGFLPPPLIEALAADWEEEQ